jgi:hypothetical protein
LRENARDELITEKIVEAVRSLPKLETPNIIKPMKTTKGYVLCLADAHYGVEFRIDNLYGEPINEYSPEIFETRMSIILSNTIEKIKQLGITELNIFDLGDGIDGILRLTSQLMKLRYGIIDSSIRYANYVSNWLNALSKFVKIKYQMVADSNHTQLRLLGAPKNAFPDENMNKVMLTLIKERLKDNPNVSILEYPTGMCYADVCGYNIIGFHGEKKNLKKNLLEMSAIHDLKISYTISGHMHHQSNDEIGQDSAVLSVGSIIGVDSYSLSLNCTSNASVSMFEFEEGKGRTAEYIFKL